MAPLFRNTMLVAEAGKGIWNIEQITSNDLPLLIEVLSVYLNKAAPMLGESVRQHPIHELRAELEEVEVLWESQVKAEHQTVLDAEQRLKKKGAAGK